MPRAKAKPRRTPPVINVGPARVPPPSADLNGPRIDLPPSAPPARRDASGLAELHSTLAVGLIALLSALAGFGTLFARPFEHQGTVAFAVDLPPGADQELANYRTALLETAWELLQPVEQDGKPLWEVVAEPQTSTLRVTLPVTDRDAGKQTLTQLADAYSEHLRQAAEAALAQHSEGERILEQRLKQLRGSRAHLLALPGDTADALGGGDPLEQREVNRNDLISHRQEYRNRRIALQQAEDRLTELRTTPLPDKPPVDPDERERVMSANQELQQDLAELRVRLATVRSQLLHAWQTSSPVLDELIEAAAALEQLGPNVHTATGPQRVVLELASEAGADYHRCLTVFAQSWSREFVGLSEEEPDPAAAGRLLEFHERVKRLLSGFLFESSKSLTVIRDQTRSLNQLSDQEARHHVLTADLTRAFHALQDAHHRFEFTASAIETTNNFRLAAAAKSADGLRHRAQLLQQQIDVRLQQQARVEAAQRRETEITSLEQQIAELRQAGDQAVEAVFAAHDRLASLAPLVEEHVWAAAMAAARAERISELADQITETEVQLADVVSRRKTPLKPTAVQVTECGVDDRPLNLNRRFAYAWTAALTTCLALLVVQRLVRPSRRRKPNNN